MECIGKWEEGNMGECKGWNDQAVNTKKQGLKRAQKETMKLLELVW